MELVDNVVNCAVLAHEGMNPRLRIVRITQEADGFVCPDPGGPIATR